MQKVIQKSRFSNLLKNEILISFLLSSLAMYLFISYHTIQYGADGSLITGDLVEQYIPALQSFARNLWAGKGLSYSWDLFLGMNSTAFNATYVGGSLVNLFYILFPFISVEKYIIFAIVFKTGLAGAAFAYFSNKVLHVEEKYVIIFAMCYAMCGFQLTSNTINFIWMDAVYILPVILVFIQQFIENGKYKGLMLGYAYLFFCNFYMGYIVGIFSGIYFVLYTIFLKKKGEETEIQGNIVKKYIGFAGSVILAVGLAAFSLVPIVYFIMTKNPADATAASNDLVQKDLLLLVYQMFYGITWNSAERLPYLYTGVIVTLLFPVFFLSKAVKNREKLMYGIMLVIMLLSCMILPLYMFWHGFDAPDWWYHRYSFIISFLMAAMACKGFSYVMESGWKKWLRIGLIELIIILGIGGYAVWRKQAEDVSMIAVQLGITFVWCLILGLIAGYKEQGRKYLIMLAIFAILLELVSNACIQVKRNESQLAHDIWKLEGEGIHNIFQQDTGFYRVNIENDASFNTDTYCGIKGTSDFWSYENYEVRKAVEYMGGFTSPRVETGYGLNPFSQLILGVKYKVFMSGESDIDRIGAKVIPYGNVLNLGFMVDSQITDYEVNEENAFEHDNALATKMLGKDIELFYPIPEEEVIITEEGISLSEDDDAYILQGEEYNEGGLAAIYYQIMDTSHPAFVAFSGYNTEYTYFRPMIYEYQKPKDHGCFDVRYTKQLDYENNSLVCAVVMVKGYAEKFAGDYAKYKEAQFYGLDTEALQEFYEGMSKNQFQVLDYENDYVHGVVNVPSKDQILFTSIPYDEGWSITSKGAEVEIVPLMDHAFIGVKFPSEGQYELTLSYVAPGQKVGIIVSIISWIIFGALLLLDHKKKVVHI